MRVNPVPAERASRLAVFAMNIASKCLLDGTTEMGKLVHPIG